MTVKNHSVDPLYVDPLYIDNTYTLPDSIFPGLDRAWCQLFVQDAKVSQTGQIKTCEFGLGFVSRLSVMKGEPIRKAIEILNQYAPIWFMTDHNYLEHVTQMYGEYAFANLLIKAMQNHESNFQMPIDSQMLKKRPAAYPKEQKFNPDAISSYSAIGIWPDPNIPSERLRNIIKYPKDTPSLLLLDEGSGTGPCLRTYGYKHISRLMMNGTIAQEQNPPFLLIETRYTTGLASFLKRKFPDDQKLMLKHVAASRGEGVIELDASSEESLDKALSEHLSDKSTFRQVSPISVCLIEKFISTPQKKDNQLKETLVRVAYLVIRNLKKVDVHLVGAVKCFGKSSCNSSRSGIVKLSKNDGTIQVLQEDDLSKIRERISQQIACVAERAICYQSDEAVRHFLESDSHILNLVGVELFAPFLICSYRKFVQPENERCPHYRYVSDQQCDLFLSLLQRNKSEIVRERILENIIRPEWKKMILECQFVPAAKLSSLLEQLIVDPPTEAFKLKCRKFLIEVYIELFETIPPSREAAHFIFKSFDLMQSEFPETFRNVSTYSWINRFKTCFYSKVFEPTFNLSNPVSLEDFLKTNVTSIPRDLYTQLFHIHEVIRECPFRLRDSLARIKKEEPFEKNWERKEWEEFFEWIKKDDMSYDSTLFVLNILPEILKLGWSVSQFKEIVDEYLRDLFALYIVQWHLQMLLFALSQIKGTDKDMSFRFFQSFIEYRVNSDCFKCLREHIQFQVIYQGKNVNAVLESMTNRFTDFRKEHSDLSSKYFAKAVEKVIERPEPQ